MQKKTPDYDNVFQTMKSKRKRLFISVINDAFRKAYPADTEIAVLPPEGFLTEGETADGSRKIEEQISDFLLRIGNETYLMECQSYITLSQPPTNSFDPYSILYNALNHMDNMVHFSNCYHPTPLFLQLLPIQNSNTHNIFF